MSFEIRRILGSAVKRIVEADQRYRMERKIMDMEDHRFSDIGVRRQDLLHQQAPRKGKTYWDIPADKWMRRRFL